jgi:mannitol-1-phosphate/altronate dehydrogenase
LGVGVTEAGLSSKDTQVMKDLFELLTLLQQLNQPTLGKLCIVNTDNVPNNATLIQSYMMEIARQNATTTTRIMETYLSTKVAFLDSMVDRITSQREGSNGLVPRCEPIPAKALVLLDPNQDLPPGIDKQPGVVVRTTRAQLETDLALKLRIANGTHTAIAHALALLQCFQTDVLSNNNPSSGLLFMRYLDSLVQHQIIPSALASPSISALEEKDVNAVWQDWRQRLLHPWFGLSTFFITQNGTAKGGIRWGPTLTDLMAAQVPITAAMALAYAILLRWLTPLPQSNTKLGSDHQDDIYRGWLDGFHPHVVVQSIQQRSNNSKNKNKEEKEKLKDMELVEYADGLHYCVQEGWYQYKCPLTVEIGDNGTTISFPSMLERCIDQKPNKCVVAVRAYLSASTGGNLDAITVASQPEYEHLVHAIASFYSRMVVTTSVEDQDDNDKNDGTAPKVMMNLLKELDDHTLGGLIGFDTPCSAMVDYYMYMSGI